MSAVTSAAARVARVLTAAALAGGLVAGCGDDDPPATPSPSSPSSSSSSSSSPTGSPTASESTSADPTGTTEPAVTPATGLLLEEETSRLHAPEGDWERIPDSVGRMSVLRPGVVSDVTLWSLLVLFVIGIPAVALWAFARSVRDDADREARR